MKPQQTGTELDKPESVNRVRELERANQELRRANAALARARQGPNGTATAPVLLRLRRAERKLEGIESSVSWRITAPLRKLKAWVRRLGDAVRRRSRRRE